MVVCCVANHKLNNNYKFNLAVNKTGDLYLVFKYQVCEEILAVKKKKIVTLLNKVEKLKKSHKLLVKPNTVLLLPGTLGFGSVTIEHKLNIIDNGTNKIDYLELYIKNGKETGRFYIPFRINTTKHDIVYYKITDNKLEI